jgi:hypothetical protein
LKLTRVAAIGLQSPAGGRTLSARILTPLLLLLVPAAAQMTMTEGGKTYHCDSRATHCVEVPPKPPCLQFTVVVKDHLNNVQQGLPPKDVKWLKEQYPGLCYQEPSDDVPFVFYIIETTDSYYNTTAHGGRAETVPAQYGIFTLTLEEKTPDGYTARHRFQEKGLYTRIYGFPVGRGHHPVRAGVEDAAKWVTHGGLRNAMQTVLDPASPKPDQ